jgi:hypothetical protein
MRTPVRRCATAAAAATLGWLLIVASAGAAPIRDFAGAGAVRVAVGPNKAIPFHLFPADNPWNADVSGLPVDPESRQYLTSIGLSTGLHPDFGTVWNGAPNGIPFITVHGSQQKVPISFYYGDESDPGPYPIPRNAPIEGGVQSRGDRHVLVLDVDHRLLYEAYDAHYDAGRKRWSAGSGSIWDLRSNGLRPDGWTSADAAGLPMLPGLVRYDEVAGGQITHALRFTVDATQRAYLYPATHYASGDTDPNLPPMGLRVRLKANYDVSTFSRPVRVILTALKKYGMIVADNGSSWYISGAPDPRWNDDQLHALGQVKGSDFEVVDTRSLWPAVPNVYAGRLAGLRAGGTLRRWGCFADPRGASWSARVQFSAGGAWSTLALSSEKRFRLVHKYAHAGLHTVSVRVTNDHGSVGTARFTVVVRPRS